MANKVPLPCLTGIVGVADTDCDCYADGRPDDYNEASSGHYLSQLVDLDLLAQAYQCASSTIWEAGQRAIDQATLRFQANVLQCLAAKHKTREQWKGLIGSRDCPNTLTPSGAFAGLYFKPLHSITDGEIVITGIGTMFRQTGEVIVRIYDELTDTFLYETTLDTTANTFQSNPLVTPIVLPYTRTDNSHVRYWMLYTVGANKPKMGEVNCGCSSNQHRMSEWASVFGTEGAALADRVDWTMGDYHYGLIPEVTFRCRVENSICKETLDFTTNPFAGVMAEAIWYLGASIVHDELRRSLKVLPATSLPHEELKADVENYKAEFAARVSALCSSMPPGSCYPCKPKMRMQSMA
jgi:hypothetical protein